MTNAPRGHAETLKQFGGTVEYLASRIPDHRFELVALDFADLERAVADGEVDFVICNPSFYVLLETDHGTTRIATLLRRVGSGVEDAFGSVVFTRSDTGIRSYERLSGRTFMAMHPTSFGGWQMAEREFVERGIDPAGDMTLSFTRDGTHDEVVEAVMSGVADAGCVRTGILESMSQEGKIDLGRIRVIEPRQIAGFTDLLSTPLYPEWAFSKAAGTDRELAERVAAALFEQAEAGEASLGGDLAGWTIPLSYTPVHELLKDLKLPPYESEGEFTARQAFEKYWPAGLGTLGVLAIMAVAVVVTARLNRQLTATNVELEHASAAKSRFLAKMSHELRTPLNSIIGFSGVMLQGMVGEVNAEQRKQLTMVNDSGKHLLALVNEVLDVSRVEAGTLVLTPSTFFVDALLASVYENFAARAADKGVRLVVVDLTEAGSVESDEPRLRQILFNLVDNAVKFTTEGEIHVRACSDADDVVFTVEDTGSGVPADRRDRIFEDFQQVERGDGVITEGLGLGLPIARSLAALLGGRLVLLPSQPHQLGSVFELRIPRRVRQV